MCHMNHALELGVNDTIADIFWAVCGESGDKALWPPEFILAVKGDTRL